MLLPPELIDYIFSFLRKDISALKACSQAHPLYSILAERHLYADISIDPPAVSEFHRQFCQNPCFLDYPRSLEIRSGFKCVFGLLELSIIIANIPRMANLISLSIYTRPCPTDHYEEFISAFATCLQQSSIEQLCLSRIYDFPLSVLDNGKNIKKLSLSDVTARREVLSTPPSQQSLETLIISVEHDQGLHLWLMHRITRLTSLELRLWWPDEDWTPFPELLSVCSYSLSRLHLGIEFHSTGSRYVYDMNHPGYWIDDDEPEFPFTLSALTRLKSLSISAAIYATTSSIECSLPEIIRLITAAAPALQHILLTFHCQGSGPGCITPLARLDWSLIDRLQSDFAGTCPPVELCITSEDFTGSSITPEIIVDALARNEALMDLVKRGLAILKSERPLSLWEQPNA